MRFLIFLKPVLNDMISSFTEEEIRALDNFIDEHFEERKDIEENPWKAMQMDELQSESDARHKYLEECIFSPPNRLSLTLS